MLQWISKNYFRAIKAATITAVILGAAFLIFNNVAPVSAQGIADPNAPLLQGVEVIREPLGLSGIDIRLIISQIIRAALGLVGIFLVGMTIYAGYLWMTAGGNDEQINDAKAMIKNAVIGLAIILLAYSIVLFVMRILGIGGLNGPGGTAVATPTVENFQGSGALGGIIRDHYPARDQTGVYRNTKIIITFSQPVDVKSFIEEGSGDGILGNCRVTTGTISWLNDCDHLKKEGGLLTDNLINIRRVNGATATPVLDAVVLAEVSTPPGSPAGVYTIVIKPLTDLGDSDGGLLGSDTENIKYAVHLGKDVLLDLPGNPSAFDPARSREDYYEWSFTTGLDQDLAPPTVVQIIPKAGSVSPRNTVIQVVFSEPMDPFGIQGAFTNTGAGFYTLAGNNIFLRTQNSSLPAGEFNLVSNYQILEFTPSTQCSVNACGNPIYCLPACDLATGDCSASNYEILLKAAIAEGAAGTRNFQSLPFSGLADLGSNALDGDKDGRVDKADNETIFSAASLLADNYYRQFSVSKAIDDIEPYLTKITPGLDAEFVNADFPLTLEFSKSIRAGSVYSPGITISEDPSRGAPLCIVPRVDYELDGDKSTVTIRHCPFLDAAKTDYYPVITSAVEDINFNCFYPGKGPKKKAIDRVSPDCSDSGTCCDVDSGANSFCCNGHAYDTTTTAAVCIGDIKSNAAAAGL